MTLDNWNNDSDLWKSFLEGDENAYAFIYEQHGKSMYTYGLRYQISTNMIEDAIHDVFVHLHHKREQLPEVSNIKGYLFISLRNLLLHKKREIALQLEVDIEETAHVLIDDAPSDNIEELEKKELDKRMLQHLTEILTLKEKEAVYYRYVQKLSYRNIADLMDIREQSAKNTVYNAIKKMRGRAIPLLSFIFFILTRLF